MFTCVWVYNPSSYSSPATLVPWKISLMSGKSRPNKFESTLSNSLLHVEWRSVMLGRARRSISVIMQVQYNQASTYMQMNSRRVRRTTVPYLGSLRPLLSVGNTVAYFPIPTRIDCTPSCMPGCIRLVLETRRKMKRTKARRKHTA